MPTPIHFASYQIPSKLVKVSLLEPSLSRTDGTHEKPLLCFNEDGQNSLQGLVADQTPGKADG